MTERSWARHYQEDWQSRAGDPRLPKWLRVAALAYGSHTDNGHARFKRGEIALILGTVDQETGEVIPDPWPGRAIEDAVEYGWLAPESFWGCLVVPAHAIKKGAHGRSPKCPIHVRRARTRGPKPSLSEGFEGHSPTPSEGFATQSPHSVRSSERKPFSSLSTPDASPVPGVSPAIPIRRGAR